MSVDPSFHEKVEGTAVQQNALLQEQKQFPLVGAEARLCSGDATAASPCLDTQLWGEIAGNEVFEAKYRGLGAAGFRAYRPVRRDGSCFYRSCLFQIFNTMALEANGCYATSATEVGSSLGPATTATAERFLKAAEQWKTSLQRYFGDFVEDFVEMAEETTKKTIAIRVPQPPPASFSDRQQLLEEWGRTIGDAVAALLNDEADNAFEYVVCLARYGVSAFLRDNSSLFAPFVSHIVDMGDDALTVSTFCEREVDVVGGECDEVHLLAFSAFFRVNVAIALMDNNITTCSGADAVMLSELKSISFVETIAGLCGGESTPADSLLFAGPFADSPLMLLYRPGHYEILFR